MALILKASASWESEKLLTISFSINHLGDNILKIFA